MAFDTDAAGLPVKAPIVRPMNAGELEEHRARRPPKPDVAAENATDGAAIAKLERAAIPNWGPFSLCQVMRPEAHLRT